MEHGTKLVSRGYSHIVQNRLRVAGLAILSLGFGIVVVMIGTVFTWFPDGLYPSSTGTLATWVVALALVVAVLVMLARKGSHAGWLHPLSLPLAALTVMSLGAPLWVYFTHEPVGLLYDSGYQPPDASALASAVSVTTCEALTLVVIGYVIGAGGALTITPRADLSGLDQSRPIFRYGGLRRAGFTLMAIGAFLELIVATLRRGTTYGADQLQYGTASILSPSAATTLLVGLILATLTLCRSKQPSRLADLLSTWEWVALLLYMLALAFTGQREGLISPLVYLAWAYSTQVRVIPLKWIVTAVLLALIGGAAISNYRADDGLSPGAPGAIVRSALESASSPAWLTQQTVIHVPSEAPYEHGSTYLAALEGQLPGPVSRMVGAPARTASAVFRNIIGFFNPNQGFAESYSSEAYLNFGLSGCLLAGLLLGALMGWAWRKSKKTATRPRNLLYPILLAGLIGGFRSDALLEIKEVLYPMVILSLVMGWCRLHYERGREISIIPVPPRSPESP
jgi:hypothetical protein